MSRADAFTGFIDNPNSSQAGRGGGGGVGGGVVATFSEAAPEITRERDRLGAYPPSSTP